MGVEARLRGLLRSTGATAAGAVCECPPMTAPTRPAPGLARTLLNGDTRTGLVNNLCFPSEVVPGYAPEGQSLASVSVIGDHADLDDALEKRVRGQLSSWFGGAEGGQVAPPPHLPHPLLPARTGIYGMCVLCS